jgi:hypothetical protein
MVSLWWVAAAFFVGGCAGVLLVAVMSMAARETGDACQPRGPVDDPLLPLSREGHKTWQRKPSPPTCCGTLWDLSFPCPGGRRRRVTPSVCRCGPEADSPVSAGDHIGTRSGPPSNDWHGQGALPIVGGNACRSQPTRERVRADHSLAIVLRKQPMRVTSTSTTSPSFMKTGGVRFAPTPPGVPVTMTSPGASGRKVDDHVRPF